MEQSIAQVEPGVASRVIAGAQWAERQLTEAERDALRPYYPARNGPDLAYLCRLGGFVLAFAAVWYFVLRRPLELPAGPFTAAAFALVGLLIAVFYSPAKLRRAFRSR